MKRTLLSTALVAALTIPAFAGTDMAPASHGKDMKDMKDTKQMATEQSDAGFYVAAYGGAQFDTDYGDNRQVLSAGGGNAISGNDINSHWGAVGGLKVGYNFQSFPICDFMSMRLQPALETEALYISDESYSNGNFSPGARAKINTQSGDFFVNGILRFKNSSMVTPYIGIGVGAQYISANEDYTAPVTGVRATGVNTDDVDFAAQALFGLDFMVCSHISLFTEYKFIDAIGTNGGSDNFGGTGGPTYRFKPDQIQQNLITAGVKYSF